MPRARRLSLLVTMAGCASSATVVPPTGSLRWSPPLIDVLGDDPATPEDDLVTLEASTLEWCSPEGACRPVVTLEPPRVIRGEASSRDGRYAVIEHAPPGGGGGLGFYDAVLGTELAWVPLDGGIPAGAPAELVWTEGDHLLRTWGAGSDDMVGTLYDTRGEVMLEILAPAISVSPDAAYLVEYVPPSTPVAITRSVALFDLATGAQVARHGADHLGVTAVEWRDDRVAITCVLPGGRTRELVWPVRHGPHHRPDRDVGLR